MTGQITSASVTSLSHVGLLCPDILSVLETWQRLFALRPLGPRPIWFASDEGVLATVLHVGDTGGVEPLQPIDDATMQADLLARGRFAFHLSLQVDDIHEVAARVRAAGLAVRMRRPGRVVSVHRGWIDESFASGITIELLDADEVAAFRGTAPPPAGDDQPLSSFIAVGHVVRDIAAAAALYARVMGIPVVDESPVTSADGLHVLQRFAPPRGPAIELVQPLDPTSVVGRRLTTFGEGMAYATFSARRLDDVEQHLVEQEAWILRGRPVSGGGSAVWVDAATTHGLPVCLVDHEEYAHARREESAGGTDD